MSYYRPAFNLGTRHSGYGNLILGWKAYEEYGRNRRENVQVCQGAFDHGSTLAQFLICIAHWRRVTST